MLEWNMRREIKRNQKIERSFFEGSSLDEISKEFGVSRERIRQILEARKRDRREFKRLSKLKDSGAF